MREPSEGCNKIPQDYKIDEQINPCDIHEVYKYRDAVWLVRISNQLAKILNHLDDGVEVWNQNDK